MTTQSAKIAMIKAHKALAAVLDAKLGNMPEWAAFRDLDRELLAGEPEPPKPIQHRVRPRLNGAQPSYMSLANRALTEAGKPIPTADMVEYISRHRTLRNPALAKIVIQSSLSKDKRFESIPWEGRRAWWFTDRPVPKETAGG
jgi:hypothetical protein